MCEPVAFRIIRTNYAADKIRYTVIMSVVTTSGADLLCKIPVVTDISGSLIRTRSGSSRPAAPLCIYSFAVNFVPCPQLHQLLRFLVDLCLFQQLVLLIVNGFFLKNELLTRPLSLSQRKIGVKLEAFLMPQTQQLNTCIHAAPNIPLQNPARRARKTIRCGYRSGNRTRFS